MHDSFRGNYPEAEDGGTARKAVACQGACSATGGPVSLAPYIGLALERVWTSGNRGSRRKLSIVPRSGRYRPVVCTIGGFDAALCWAGRVAEDDGDLRRGRARPAALARRVRH